MAKHDGSGSDIHELFDDHSGQRITLCGQLVWYPPVLVSEWGTPRERITNWGDLFMDLVYVAATYKLGTAVSDELVTKDCDTYLYV